MTAHVEVLALARRLAQADARTVPECRRELLLYWYGFGGSHLHAEEDVLLAAWERHGGADHPLNAAIRAEQARLAEQVAAIAADSHPTTDALHRVGAALAVHVHRHERELAGAVARTLPDRERSEMERELAHLEGVRVGYSRALTASPRM